MEDFGTSVPSYSRIPPPTPGKEISHGGLGRGRTSYLSLSRRLSLYPIPPDTVSLGLSEPKSFTLKCNATHWMSGGRAGASTVLQTTVAGPWESVGITKGPLPFSPTVSWNPTKTLGNGTSISSPRKNIFFFVSLYQNTRKIQYPKTMSLMLHPRTGPKFL